jgi:hypothetical protein
VLAQTLVAIQFKITATLSIYIKQHRICFESHIRGNVDYRALRSSNSFSDNTTAVNGNSNSTCTFSTTSTKYRVGCLSVNFCVADLL